MTTKKSQSYTWIESVSPYSPHLLPFYMDDHECVQINFTIELPILTAWTYKSICLSKIVSLFFYISALSNTLVCTDCDLFLIFSPRDTGVKRSMSTHLNDKQGIACLPANLHLSYWEQNHLFFIFFIFLITKQYWFLCLCVQFCFSCSGV